MSFDNWLRKGKERIGYKLEYGTLPTGITSAKIEVLVSGVELGFSLPEAEDDYDKYILRLDQADSNLFRLHSISLMTKQTA